MTVVVVVDVADASTDDGSSNEIGVASNSVVSKASPPRAHPHLPLLFSSLFEPPPVLSVLFFSLLPFCLLVVGTTTTSLVPTATRWERLYWVGSTTTMPVLLPWTAGVLRCWIWTVILFPVCSNPLRRGRWKLEKEAWTVSRKGQQSRKVKLLPRENSKSLGARPEDGRVLLEGWGVWDDWRC